MPPSTPAPVVSSAIAPAGAGSAAFAGTIVSTYPDGRTARLWLHSDGAYTARGRRGDSSAGRWRIGAGRVCLRQSRPWPIPFSYCQPFVSIGYGSTWSGRAPTGEAIRLTLVPGRADEPAR